MNAQLGEAIKIRHQDFSMYLKSIEGYGIELAQRLKAYFNHNRDEKNENNIRDIEEELKTLRQRPASNSA